jgi:hypothetical protein
MILAPKQVYDNYMFVVEFLYCRPFVLCMMRGTSPISLYHRTLPTRDIGRHSHDSRTNIPTFFLCLGYAPGGWKKVPFCRTGRSGAAMLETRPGQGTLHTWNSDYPVKPAADAKAPLESHHEIYVPSLANTTMA